MVLTERKKNIISKYNEIPLYSISDISNDKNIITSYYKSTEKSFILKKDFINAKREFLYYCLVNYNDKINIEELSELFDECFRLKKWK